MNEGMKAELCGWCPCAQRVVYGFSWGTPETLEKGETEADLPGREERLSENVGIISFFSVLPAAVKGSAELMKCCSRINSVFG